MDTRASTRTRLSVLPVLIALLMNLFIGPLAPIIQQLDANVLAAPVTVPDEDGPNDEPGQKDLTQLTIDYDSAPGVTLVSWNWDETGTSGANTLDACSLFDIDDNLFVDFALCAITVGDPAQSSPGSPRAYTCGDDRVDRCTNQVLVSDFDSTCTIGTGVNPFNGDDDATASCTILLSDLPVGSADPVLVNVCTYPSQIPHSDPSDCVLIPRTAFLTVIKEVINDNGGDAEVGDFPLFIDDMSVISGDRTPVTAAIHTVSETSQPGYDMTGISGDCAADGTITVEAGDDLTCTITNDDVGASLTVTKIVVNDNGGTAEVADFPLFIDATGVTSGAANAVDAGLHTVSETGMAGYTGTIGGDCAADGSVTLALGESKACTITNDDNAPGLTLVKELTLDDGGTAAEADWTLTATGPTGFSGSTPVSNGAGFEAGTYDLSESGPDGYTGSAWVCVGGTQDDDDTITLALGESATCTITNDDDSPSLTLVKEVQNDNGGTAQASDWTLTATGPTGFSGLGPNVGSEAGFDAGTYDLSEAGPGGYTASDWVCVGGTQDDADTITLAVGESATCTITNDDEPGTLTVTKVISGGDADCDDFSFQVDGGTAIPFEADCSNDVSVAAGDYDVTEPAVDGYTASYTNSENANLDCTDLTVVNGGGASCEITNTRDTGDLTVIKDLDPDSDSGLFNLLINGTVEATDVGEGGTAGPVTVDTGTHTVGETAGLETSLDDYQTSISCWDGETEVTATNLIGTSWSVDVTKDADVVCTILNTRETGDLTVIKALSPSDDSGLFDLLIDGNVEADEVGDGGTTGAVTVNTGTHTVGEEAGDGFSLGNYSSEIECRDGGGEGEIVRGASGAGPVDVDVAFGDDIVCVISNTRVTVGFEKSHGLGDNNTVLPGEIIHYTLSVFVNNGMATNALITDVIPDGLTFVEGTESPTEGFSQDGQNLTWDLAMLTEGEHTFTYDAMVDADAEGTLTNLGCIDVDQNDDQVCFETDVRVQHISVDKTNGVEGAVVPGTVVDFTLTLDVTNGPIENITIVDELPDGISGATDISGGGLYDPTTNDITWVLEDVVDNQTLTYSAAVNATATAGNYTNVATITEGPCASDCDDDSTVTVRVPTLVVDKAASLDLITISGPANAPVATPSVVTWTLTYTLTDGPVTNAVISDEIPVGFVFLDAANGGTEADGVVTWTFAELNTSGSVTFRTTVDPATISLTAPTVNTAIIDSDQTPEDEGQDSVTVTREGEQGGNPTPAPPLPNTALGTGLNGEPITVPIELLVAFFIGSLGALALANVKSRNNRR